MSTREDRIGAPAAEIVDRAHGLGALLRTSLPLMAILVAVVSAAYVYANGGPKLGMSATAPPAGLPSLRDVRPLVEPEPVKDAASSAVGPSPETVAVVVPDKPVIATSPSAPPTPLQSAAPGPSAPEIVVSVPAPYMPDPVRGVEAQPIVTALKAEPITPPQIEANKPVTPTQTAVETAPAARSPSQVVAASPAASAAGPEVSTRPGAGLLQRGRALLDQGNIAAARLFLERATTAESAEAALLLGASYDPKWLASRGALGVAADPAKARKWYLEAERLGSPDAAARLSGLTDGRR